MFGETQLEQLKKPLLRMRQHEQSSLGRQLPGKGTEQNRAAPPEFGDCLMRDLLANVRLEAITTGIKKLLGAPGIATRSDRTLVAWRPSLLG